jgi:hypothetical protein
LVAAVWAPVLAFYIRPRRRRERYLTGRQNSVQVVQSVYLTPNLLRFVEREAETPVNPYSESMTLTSSSSALEFWSGGAAPVRAAIIDFAEIDSVRFLEDDDHFPRTEISVNRTPIPLYPVVGWLGISRKSSRRLYDRLVASLDLVEH